MEDMNNKENRDEETEVFLKSFIFMRLGQAISKGNWQGARMTFKKMENEINRLGLERMKSQLPGLRMAIFSKNKVQAKNALALLVAKRVQLLEGLSRFK